MDAKIESLSQHYSQVCERELPTRGALSLSLMGGGCVLCMHGGMRSLTRCCPHAHVPPQYSNYTALADGVRNLGELVATAVEQYGGGTTTYAEAFERIIQLA